MRGRGCGANTSVPKILQSKWVRWTAIAAAVVGLYALLGFQLAPRIVKSQAVSFVKQEYGRDLGIGVVRINPFLLQLEINELSMPDADGKPMAGFRRLFVDFELSSIWHRAYVFKDLILEAPDLRAIIRPGGALNLADLAPKEQAPKEQKPSELPSLWLKSLAVSDGVIGFSDRARAKPFERRFSPVTFTLKDFRTTPEGGGFQLAARSESGEGFDWKGRFEVAPRLASRGDIAIHGLKARGISEYLDDALPFGMDSGLIDLGGHYDVSWGESLNVNLSLPKISVTDLGLRARGADANWINVPGIVVSDTTVALPAQTVSIGDITVTDMKVQAWMAADGTVNLTQLFAPGAATESAAAPGAPSVAGSAPPATAPDPAAPAWKVEVATTQVAHAAIDVEDRRSDPVKHFTVSPLDVTVRGAGTDLAKPVAITVGAVVNDVAPFKAEGTVTPEPLAADLAIALTGARMQILQPYVLPVADLTIKDGRLSVEGKLRLDPPEAPGPELSFDGEVTVENFASIDNTLKQDLVNFGRLELHKLSYAMGPDSASIDQVVLHEPFARVIISPERVINISAVMDPEGTAAALEARRAAAAADAALTPAQRRERDRERDKAAEQAAKARKAQGAAAKPALAPLPAETMPVRIRQVRVDRGTLDFTDNNVQPNFSARIQQLNGTMSGLSSDPASHAKVDFKGRVGEFSPVTITGEVQPFSLERYADIGLRFENISLPIFNPYSGRFAGYGIAKGKLTTDLHYLITDRKLDARHHIVIDQLEWGEATGGKDEATLPVKFATVLLRDRNGVIDLDIPVTGTLDDPTFRIGPIVWQVIKNLIVKAVTAPFALLGALFSGAEEAQHVAFAAGSAALDPATVGQLGALSKSLVEKPGLKVDVPIGALPELDGPALQDSAYAAALAEAISTTLTAPRKDGGAAPAFEALPAEDRIAVLTALVKQQTGAEPAIPEPPEPPEGTSRADAKAMKQAAAIDYLAKEARSHLSVRPEEYDRLAEARAAAVQRALLDGSELEPTRVFLVRNGKVTAQDGKLLLDLELK
jgi:hypothetical protein